MSAATKMRSTCLALSSALLLAAPAGAAVSDFRLPPPSETQPQPDRQGPVAPDVPESRSAPAPTPSATAETLPPPLVTPTVVPPPVTASPRATPTTTPTPTPTRQAATPDAIGAPAAEPSPGEAPAPAPSAPLEQPSPSIAPAPAPTDSAPVEGEGAWWPWLLAGALVVVALAAAGVAWRRKQGAAVKALEIERPRVAPSQPARAPLPAQPQTAAAEPLQVELEPLRMSLTLMNAALAYRLQVTNRGSSALSGLSIGADMIAAHASMSREQHLSGPASGAATQRIDRLEPGESRVIEGEFRVPFSQITPIRQGNAALLLPLARFRLEAQGATPVVRAFAVGQPGNGALQPFRLDQGPRIYPNLAQRAFA